MSKFFPKLTQNEVFIKLDEEGNGFNCPMLPVSKLDELDKCSLILRTSKKITEIEQAKTSLVNMAQSVLPFEYHANLKRLPLDKLAELVAYLMFGDTNDDDQPKKKV